MKIIVKAKDKDYFKLHRMVWSLHKKAITSVQNSRTKRAGDLDFIKLLKPLKPLNSP